jgi:hypothetical protein
MSALKSPSTQTSTVRAELAHLNGVHEDFPLERAAVDRVLRALVALINAGQIPFGEWHSAAWSLRPLSSIANSTGSARGNWMHSSWRVALHSCL